ELDELGRAKRVTDYSGKKVEYGFGPDGERTSIKYPDDKIVEYEYDGALRLKTLIDGDKRIGYMYDENSRLHEKVFPNGTSAKYSYNEAGLLSELSSIDRDGLLDKYAYSYDNMSNTVRVEKYRRGLQEENGQYQYTYDALSRLTGVIKDDSLIKEYGYDDFGNRSFMVDGGVRTDYTYNPLNQLLRLENVGLRQDFIYDARGNLTRVLEDGRFKNSYEFDPMNRLAKAESAAGQTAFYDYNGLGNRVKRRVTDGVDPTKEISYVLDLTKQYHNLLQTTSKDGQTRNYAWDSNVASENISDGESRYYLNDELGSPLRLTYSDGALADSYAYDEFGADRAGNQGLSQPFGFTGYQYDALSGTYFAQAREYDPRMGRMISEDGREYIHQMDPRSLNLYTYCTNNPIIWVDPSGHDKELDDYINDNYAGKTTITFVVMQPTDGSRNVLNPDNDVGHTFIRLQNYETDASGNMVEKVSYMGFYPAQPLTMDQIINRTDVAGAKIDDKDHSWNIAKVYEITNDQALASLKYMNDFSSDYNMVTNNCTTFAVGALTAAGITSPTSEHNWKLTVKQQLYAWLNGYSTKGLKGYSPADAGQDIRKGKAGVDYITPDSIKNNSSNDTKKVT
ncbi:MAG: RHS repeat-associated core domain-containing protein, partial [Oscillospiraceae bacterium]|nr:RHS repeat-associated core domain-containing protein [Oscillospiraceae bacterium]